MRATFKANNTKEIEFTLTVTMPLKDWDKMREQLSNKWPSGDLAMSIIEMVHSANKHFEPEQHGVGDLDDGA